MSDFWIYLEIGLRHILDIKAYLHLLFLIVLTVPYTFKDWKKVLILVTIFTVAQTLSLFLSLFEVIIIKASLIEFLLPVTILITALYDLISSGKSSKGGNIEIIGFITLSFGLIHGLGFSNHFNTLLSGSSSAKLLPTLEFALGIELAQIAVALVILMGAYIIQNFFRLSKRDWTLVLSAFVIGVVLPLIVKSEIWYK